MVLSTRHLVGREHDLAALLQLIELPDQLPMVAVIVGEAGIGKTTLSRAAVDAAEARGYRVLLTRPSETEARFSFAGLADLIGAAIPDVLPQLPRPQRRALQAALALSESDAVSTDEGVVAFAFLSALRTLATSQRLLLSIDDVQWLDAPSRSILQFALHRLERLPVAAILTARGEVPLWLKRAVPENRLLTFELGPLSVGAIREMLRTRLGAVLPRPTLLRIWETSGGNPFFALEFASALQRRGGRLDPGEELTIPANLEGLIHDRLDHVGADALAVAAVVAALANPTLPLIEAAAGGRAESGLSAARAGGILEVDGNRVRFTHPLLRSAVASSGGHATRRAIHARLAKLVVDGEERARHLALAAARPSRAVAAVVERAAFNLQARGAVAAAAELGELAVRLTPRADDTDMRRRVLDCADRYRLAGDGGRAIELLEQTYTTAPPGPTRAAVLIRLARAMEDFVGPREAVERYREALVEADGDDALLAETHLRLVEIVKVMEERNVALEHAELAVQAASRLGDVALRCNALAAYSHLNMRLGRGVASKQMEEALALERSLPRSLAPGPATWALVYQLVWSGDLERGRSLLESLNNSLNADENPEAQLSHWYLSILEWRAGNWELAARHAADSLAIRAQFGLEVEQAGAELPASMVEAHRGQIADARERSERALKLAEAEGVLISQSGHLSVLGFIELSLGDPAMALTYLKRGWELRDSVLLLEPGHRLELSDTLEALIAVGELVEAERRIIEWEERSRAVDRSWAIAIVARCRALLFAARGDLATALKGFEYALIEHARTQDPFQHARTLLAYGITQRRARQRGAARVTLERALEIFERLGAPLWADMARSEVRRIGGRARSSGELTEGERRIAAFVAEGRTNREVAAALFVTEHTVEAALTRAYQKLGVRSRAGLGARLRRES